MLHTSPPAFGEPAFDATEAAINAAHVNTARGQLRDAIVQGTCIHEVDDEVDTMFCEDSLQGVDQPPRRLRTELVQRARVKAFCRRFLPQDDDIAALACNHTEQRGDYLLENVESLLQRIPLAITVGGDRISLQAYQRVAIASSACTLPRAIFARASVSPERIGAVQLGMRKRRRASAPAEGGSETFLHASVQIPAGEVAPVELVAYLNRCGKAAVTLLAFLAWMAFPSLQASTSMAAARNTAFRRGLGLPQEVDDSRPPAPVMIVVCEAHKRARWVHTALGACAEATRFYGMPTRVWDGPSESRGASLEVASDDGVVTVWVLDATQIKRVVERSPRIAFVQLTLVEGVCDSLPKWSSPFLKLVIVTSTPNMLDNVDTGELHPLRELLGGSSVMTLDRLRWAVANRRPEVARPQLSHWCLMAVAAPPPFMLDCLARAVAMCMPDHLLISTVICARNSVQDRSIGGFARVDFVELLEMLSEDALSVQEKEWIRDALETPVGAAASAFSVQLLARALDDVAGRILQRASLQDGTKNKMASNVRRLASRVDALMQTSESCPICWEPMGTSGQNAGRILSCCTSVVCETCVPELTRCPTCRSPRKAAGSVVAMSPTERLRTSLPSMSIEEGLHAVGQARLSKAEAVRAIVRDIIRPKRPNATVLIAMAAASGDAAALQAKTVFPVRFVEDLRKELPSAVVTCSRSALGWSRGKLASALDGHPRVHAVLQSHLMSQRFREFESPLADSPMQVILLNACSSDSEDEIPTAEFTLLCDTIEPATRSRILGAALAWRSVGVSAEARAIVVRH